MFLHFYFAYYLRRCIVLCFVKKKLATCLQMPIELKIFAQTQFGHVHHTFFPGECCMTESMEKIIQKCHKCFK